MTNPSEIKKVDIRSVWPGEAREFTPWLGENLEVFANHLGLPDLTLEGTEMPITGGRSLDICAVDSGGRFWAIENQYGIADHDHLTRGLAYAVALNCCAMVLVAEDHRPEFIAIAEEWNRYAAAFGPEGIRVFLVVVEAFQIGASEPGFRFRVVEGPNEWRQDLRAAAGLSAADSVRHQDRRQFWQEFLDQINERSKLFVTTTARTGPWLGVTTGPFHKQIWVKTESCRVQLRIDGGDADSNQNLFDELLQHKKEIEEGFGAPLSWEQAASDRACYIRYEIPQSAGYRTPASELQRGITTAVDATIRFNESIETFIRDLT